MFRNRVATVAVALICFPLVNVADSDFKTWLKQDNAIRKSASAQVSVGDFRLQLPMGWIVDSNADNSDGVKLAYVGPRAVSAPPPVHAELHVLDAPVRERGGAAESWPSSFSGWETFRANELWAVRCRMPSSRAGADRLAIEIPTSLATLTVGVDFPGSDGPIPSFVEQLLQTLVYVGSGIPLAPPGKGSDRSRAAASTPAVDIAPQALASSPLHPFVAKTRQAIAQGVDPSTENYVTLLDTGADALLARLHLIRSAKRTIRIQTFIWGNDEVGRLLLYELIEAAKRGVQVLLIIDHIASFRDVELAAFVATASPNLTVRHYRPSSKRIDPAPLQESLDFLIPNKTNQRMHNKLFIVDDVAAITGGRNIDNSYYAQSDTINFRDRDVFFIGPMVAYAVRSFQEYWSFDKCVRTSRLKDVKKAIKKDKFTRLETREEFALNGYFETVETQLSDPAQIERVLVAPLRKVDNALFLADPPGKTSRRYTAWRRGTIARQLESIMRSAEHSLVLQTPYLILDGGMLKIMKGLREQNPNIELLASSNSFGATDNPIAYAANFKMRPAYVKAGIYVYEYRQLPDTLNYQLPNYSELLGRNTASRSSGAIHQKDKPFLCIHAKALVVDSLIAFVGSYNFDPRSISLNTEVGLLVQDPEFAARVRRDIQIDIAPENSWVVARRKEPRPLKDIQRHMPKEASRARIDMWPFRNTTGYELRAGQAPTLPSRPEFYSIYEDIGAFPGAEDEDMAMKKVIASISTVLSGLVVPLL